MYWRYTYLLFGILDNDGQVWDYTVHVPVWLSVNMSSLYRDTGSDWQNCLGWKLIRDCKLHSCRQPVVKKTKYDYFAEQEPSSSNASNILGSCYLYQPGFKDRILIFPVTSLSVGLCESIMEKKAKFQDFCIYRGLSCPAVFSHFNSLICWSRYFLVSFQIIGFSHTIIYYIFRSIR